MSCRNSAAGSCAGRFGQPSGARRSDRPGTRRSKGGGSEARSRSSRCPATRRRAARDHLRLTSTRSGRRTEADAAGNKAYYDAHPALFSQRRLYSFQEINIQAKPEQVDTLRAKLGAAKDLAEFVAFLKSSDIKYSANEAVRGAEQLPLASLDRISQMKDGQSMFSVVPGGVSVLYLAGSRSQPVDEQRAVPAIEQFLLNSRKRKLVEDDLKALRSGSKIEYVGTYAADAAKAAAAAPPPAPDAPPLMTIAPTLPPAASAAPQIEVAPTPVKPAAMPSNTTLDKGLKGINRSNARFDLTTIWVRPPVAGVSPNYSRRKMNFFFNLLVMVPSARRFGTPAPQPAAAPPLGGNGPWCRRCRPDPVTRILI